MTDEESVRFRQIAVLGVRRNIRDTALEDNKRMLQSINPYGSFHALPELTPSSCAPRSVPPSGETALSYRGLPYDLLEDLLPNPEPGGRPFLSSCLMKKLRQGGRSPRCMEAMSDCYALPVS
jgi:hypothetical protein